MLGMGGYKEKNHSCPPGAYTLLGEALYAQTNNTHRCATNWAHQERPPEESGAWKETKDSGGQWLGGRTWPWEPAWTRYGDER